MWWKISKSFHWPPCFVVMCQPELASLSPSEDAVNWLGPIPPPAVTGNRRKMQGNQFIFIHFFKDKRGHEQTVAMVCLGHALFKMYSSIIHYISSSFSFFFPYMYIISLSLSLFVFVVCLFFHFSIIDHLLTLREAPRITILFRGIHCITDH